MHNGVNNNNKREKRKYDKYSIDTRVYKNTES